MKKTVCFDVDGTLIVLTGENEDTPRYDVIALFKTLEAFDFEMFIWSGGGMDYAERWMRKLGLNAQIVPKASFTPDLAIDDEEVKLGRVNIRVYNKEVKIL